MKIRIFIGFIVCLFVAQNYAFSDDVECGDTEVQETDVITGESVCVCKQGYYKDESDYTCHKCEHGKTTEGTGALGEEACNKYLFKYKDGADDKTWAWPATVTEVEIYTTNIRDWPDS